MMETRVPYPTDNLPAGWRFEGPWNYTKDYAPGIIGYCHGSRDGKMSWQISCEGEDYANDPTEYCTLRSGFFPAPADPIAVLRACDDVAEGVARQILLAATLRPDCDQRAQRKPLPGGPEYGPRPENVTDMRARTG